MKRNVIAIEHSGISSMKWGVTLLLLNTVNILYEVKCKRYCYWTQWNILYEMKRNVIAIEHSGNNVMLIEHSGNNVTLHFIEDIPLCLIAITLRFTS